jgi:hypothetical protein
MNEMSVLEMPFIPEIGNLELAMQELEPLEAPGFWSGFKAGVAISGATVAAAASGAAISVAVT